LLFGGGDMAALNFNALFFNHEISFCISFFVEWQEQRLWERFFRNVNGQKNVFTIHINEADTGLARDLVEGIDCVQIASA